MLNVGQINFKEFSKEDILKQSKDTFEKFYLYNYFRIGCEQDITKDSLILNSYLNYYEKEECEHKHYKKRKRCKCEQKCITSKCNSNVQQW